MNWSSSSQIMTDKKNSTIQARSALAERVFCFLCSVCSVVENSVERALTVYRGKANIQHVCGSGMESEDG